MNQSGKNLKRQLQILSLLTVMSWSFILHDSHVVASPSRARVADLRQKQARKQSEAREVRGKLRILKKKERAVTARLQDSQQKMENAHHQLVRVNRKLTRTLTSLDQTRDRLDHLRRQLNSHLDELSDLLVAHYRSRRSGYAELLLTSNSFSDLMRRTEFVKRIAVSDNELIETVIQEQGMVRQKESELETQKDRAETLKAIVGEKHEQYQTAAAEQRRLLSSITHQRAEYEEYLRELEQSSREIERLIRRLSAQRRRRGQPSTLPSWNGSFSRPVNGSVTSGFGYRTHPIFRIRKMHTGVDLGASYGTSIHAAANGVVIFAGWKRGYGKTIVIDHGGDLATLYAHCSALSVSAGDNVTQGTVIARVGSTGYSTGPHLHFEVRRSGTPVNPLSSIR